MRPVRRRVASALALVAVAGGAACLRGNAKVPDLPPARTLAPEGELGAAKPTRDFAVVFARPQGPVIDPSEISIVWNRPMRPLELAGEESAAPATVIARDGSAIAGSWRWMGTSAVLFAPSHALPQATEFVVTVPRGTKAMDGAALADDYTFSFSTARPKILRLSAAEGTSHLLPRSTFELRFNQPVELAEVERATTIKVGAEPKPWGFHASWVKPKLRTLVKITPAAPLPLDAEVNVTVDRSLHGVEGPLPLGEPRSLTLSTYGPLAVRELDCDRETPNKKCAGGRSEPRIVLSNDVSCKEIQAHVRVMPDVPLRWECGEMKTTYWGVPGTFKHAKKYVITVTPGLRDVYGQALARPVALDFDTDDLWPSVELGVEGTVFEAGPLAPPPHAPPSRIVPVAAINTGAYELLAAPLNESQVARYLAADRRGYDAAIDLLHPKLEEVRPKVRKNAMDVKDVDLDALVGKAGRGAAFVGYHTATPRMWGSDSDVRLVTVTDLAISAKLSRFGGVAWVTRLSDGRPVPGAVVAIRNDEGKEVFQTRVDDSGVAVLPEEALRAVRQDGSTDEHAVVFARAGDDWTFKDARDRVSEWRLGVPTDFSGRLPPIGMLFSERGVYRPGETVRVKGLFRQPRPRTTVTPEGSEVGVEARDGAGDKIFEATLKLDAFGGFAVDIPVPATAHLGTGEVVAQVAGEGEDHPVGTASTSMMLAEYRPAEFKVRVDAGRPSYTRGEQAAFETHGDYLFGAPMSGGKVHYTATRGRTAFTPPGAEGLVVDDDVYAADLRSDSFRGSQLVGADGVIGPKGALSTKVPLAMPAQRGPETVTFESEVTDVSRQAIAGRASVLVHPGEFYVALKRPADVFVHKGDTLRPEILAIDPAGVKREGVRVHLELVRRSWRSVLESTGESSRHYQSTVVDKVVSSCDVTTAAAPATCDLAVLDAGYLLVHATAKDARQNPLAASASLYGFGESEDLGWAMSDAASVELVADRRSYEVGDTATILVKNPYREATALVTLERAGVYFHERRTLTGPMPTLTFPITDDLRPNAFVSVHIVEGRTDAAPVAPEAGRDLAPDKGVPSYRMGYVTLSVNPEARRLHVSVEPAKRSLGPGDTVDADIRVADREGHPVAGEVTFYAVDEGVLMLTDYRTPDPIPVFTAPRPLAVFALETRQDLARVFINPNGGAGGDKGADGGGGGSTSVRSDFRATAYFAPSLATGKDGKAHVQFKLPDSLTTYRLMAVVAAADDRFGFGQSEVVASRPLMARPALPRFLRAGDTMEAGIVVSSKGLAAGDVEATLAATGVSVTADAKRQIALPANGSVEVRWPVSAPTAGKAELTFAVRGLSGDGASAPHDEVRVARDIEVPLVPEAVALYGETTGIASERLGDFAGMRGDTGGLDLRLASTALVGLEDGADALIKYPYGCTEQLTSRLVPLVPLVGLARDYHVDLPQNLDAVIDDTVAKILKNQRSDGSFGWWVDSRVGDPWLTPYALWGLSVAKAAGHPVPDDAIEGAIKAVRAWLPAWQRDSWSLATAAFALDVLATVGSPDIGYMDRLYEKRSDLPLFARAFLAHALVVSRGKEAVAQVAELDRDLESHLRVTAVGATVVENVGSEYASLMDSEAWQTAVVLRSLVAIDPEHPLAGRIAKGLLALRKAGSWGTTRDNAWALLALDDYRHAQEKDVPDFDAKVSLGSAEVFAAPFHERSTRAAASTIPAAKLSSGLGSGAALTFDVEGKGKLFYEARLRYSKKELPREGLDRGFTVKKLVRSVRPEQLREALATVPTTTATSAVAGDMVLVDLFVVTADPREQVVLQDPLPAGLEAVDATLATTARTLNVTDAGGAGDESNGDSDEDSRANGLAYNPVWYHREIRDDRVLTFVEHMAAGMYHFRYLARATTIGRFVVPPTDAACMYEPETFGRTAGASFEVKAP